MNSKPIWCTSHWIRFAYLNLCFNACHYIAQTSCANTLGYFYASSQLFLCINSAFKTLVSCLVPSTLSLSIKWSLNVTASLCTVCSPRLKFFYSVLCSECHLQLWKSFSYPFSSQSLELLLMKSFFYCFLCLRTFPFTISMPKFEELNSYKSNL